MSRSILKDKHVVPIQACEGSDGRQQIAAVKPWGPLDDDPLMMNNVHGEMERIQSNINQMHQKIMSNFPQNPFPQPPAFNNMLQPPPLMPFPSPHGSAQGPLAITGPAQNQLPDMMNGINGEPNSPYGSLRRNQPSPSSPYGSLNRNQSSCSSPYGSLSRNQPSSPYGSLSRNQPSPSSPYGSLRRNQPSPVGALVPMTPDQLSPLPLSPPMMMSPPPLQMPPMPLIPPAPGPVIRDDDVTGYRVMELVLDVKGYQPEDIHINTEGNVLYVHACHLAAKHGVNNSGVHDARVAKECRRQYTLPEVVRAENLRCYVNRKGELTIEGPLGTYVVRTLTKKKVKFAAGNK